jgi:uncharacterized protein HemX
MSWLTLKTKLAAAGAVLLALGAAVVRVQWVKKQRDVARESVDILQAQRSAIKIKEKIKKEVEVKLSLRRAEIKQELERIKKGDKSEGVSNLTRPNDY